jgi:chromosome segregation ATPase
MMKSVLLAAALFAQNPNQTDTMQALLSEVRQLRQAIEGMTGASQRVQIALYALQMQDAAVARVTQRFDTAHGKCVALEEHRKALTTQLRNIESSRSQIQGEEAKHADEMLTQFRSGLELAAAEATSCLASEAEVAGQLRAEQAKLTELQDRIARLDKALESYASQGR